MRVLLCLAFVVTFSFLSKSRAAEACTADAAIDGAVSTATNDFVERAIARAVRESCKSILFTVNTPGGSLQTTRKIVEKILASPIPVLCVVGPEGGHAGSAGALILLACHVSGVLPATNIGAATPIAGGGQTLGDDLRKKVVEDTKSWAIALAKKRGRSVVFAEKIITEAKAYPGDEALKAGGVDILAKSVPDFLQQATGRAVSMSSSIEASVKSAPEATLKVEVGRLLPIEKDWREKLLTVMTDPEFSYLLFMFALGLLYFELTHPGAIAPGVVGSLMLVTSLIAFEKLDVAWGGVGLMALGVIFLVAEAFVPSFGALGIGGILALGAGSILLYDPASGGLSLSLWLSLGVPLTLGLSLFGVAIWIFKTRRRSSESVAESGVIGAVVRIDKMGENEHTGTVTVRGEIWSVQSEDMLLIGDAVRITAIRGLKLEVVKIQAR